MTRACPVGHPSAEGMKHCALCGRAYVAADQVAPPVSVEQVLADGRVRRRAERAAALSSPPGTTDTAADTAADAVADAADASTDGLEADGLVDVVVAASAQTVLPGAARLPDDNGADSHQPRHSGPGALLTVRARVLSCGAAALFVTAFALGESVTAFNLVG